MKLSNNQLYAAAFWVIVIGIISCGQYVGCSEEPIEIGKNQLEIDKNEGLYEKSVHLPDDDFPSREDLNRALYPEGDGKLPEDPEERALLYLSPHPQGYIGHLPDDFNFEEFQYSYHQCHNHEEGLICTACYSHPKNYLGNLSVLCPYEGDECTLLLLAADLIKTYNVDPAYCENGPIKD